MHKHAAPNRKRRQVSDGWISCIRDACAGYCSHHLRPHAETPVPAAQVVDIVNISDPKGWTCLLCAAQHDMPQIAALLLPLGAAVHASLHASGNTAAHIAALKGEDGMPSMAQPPVR